MAVLDRLVVMGATFSVDFHLASARVLIPAARSAMPQAAVVFVNMAEFVILSAVADLRALRTVVVSDGPRAAAVLCYGQRVASVLPPATEAIEVTGAGDILAGTFLAASARGLNHQAALREAVNAASSAIVVRRLTIPACEEACHGAVLRSAPAVRSP